MGKKSLGRYNHIQKIDTQSQRGAVLVVVTIVSFILASLMVGTALQSTFKQVQIIEDQNKVASFEASQSCLDIVIEGIEDAAISPDPLTKALQLNGKSYHNIPANFLSNKLCTTTPCALSCSVSIIYLTEMTLGTGMASDGDQTNELPIGARFKLRSEGRFKEANTNWKTVIYRGLEVP